MPSRLYVVEHIVTPLTPNEGGRFLWRVWKVTFVSLWKRWLILIHPCKTAIDVYMAGSDMYPPCMSSSPRPCLYYYAQLWSTCLNSLYIACVAESGHVPFNKLCMYMCMWLCVGESSTLPSIPTKPERRKLVTPFNRLVFFNLSQSCLLLMFNMGRALQLMVRLPVYCCMMSDLDLGLPSTAGLTLLPCSSGLVVWRLPGTGQRIGSVSPCPRLSLQAIVFPCGLQYLDLCVLLGDSVVTLFWWKRQRALLLPSLTVVGDIVNVFGEYGGACVVRANVSNLLLCDRVTRQKAVTVAWTFLWWGRLSWYGGGETLPSPTPFCVAIIQPALFGRDVERRKHVISSNHGSGSGGISSSPKVRHSQWEALIPMPMK